MLICDNGNIREMTPEEEYIANNLPDPNEPDAEAEDFQRALEDLGVNFNEEE